jgi:integrase
MRVLREGPVKITRAKVEAAWRQRAKNERLVLSDLECRGLALVVNTSSMAWRFDYKPRGLDPATGKRFHSRSITIGSPSTHSPDEARAEANKHKGQAKAGRDPAAERKAQITASAQRRGRTLKRLLEQYSEVLPTRPKLRGNGTISPRHAAHDLAYVKAAITVMKAGDKAADDVTAADLRGMLRACGSRAATARHYYGALSRFFDWAQDESLIKANPCLLVAKARRPRPVAARENFLSLSQLAQLWKAAAIAKKLKVVHRDYVQFLIAVPCRRDEAASLDWSHLELATGTWSQPGRLTKNRDAHRIYLPALPLDILTRRHDAAGKPTSGLVFPSPRARKSLQTFGDIKDRLEEAAPDLGDWRFHDNRRSFATILGEAGVSETVADAILNHRQSATRSGVLGTYQRAQRWPEQVAAMKVWNNALESAISGAQHPSKVIPLVRGHQHG